MKHFEKKAILKDKINALVLKSEITLDNYNEIVYEYIGEWNVLPDDAVYHILKFSKQINKYDNCPNHNDLGTLKSDKEQKIKECTNLANKLFDLAIKKYDEEIEELIKKKQKTIKSKALFYYTIGLGKHFL